MSNLDLIKELRTLTAAPMKDCVSALKESNDDLQAAVDIIKTKGLNVASGRDAKVASEGAVAVCEVGNTFGMVEVNCNTDFCANSPDFVKFVKGTALKLAQLAENNQTFTVDEVELARAELISKTKENILVRRWWAEQPAATGARTFAYVHSNNKIGVLLTLLSSADHINDRDVTELGNDLAMQVAAMNPLAVSVDRLNPEDVSRQQSIFEAQLTELKKPQAAWGKILEGKNAKWHSEVCLLNQESVVHAKTTIQQLIKNLEVKLNTTITVVGFVRCQVGDGLEHESVNLADEVAKMM